MVLNTKTTSKMSPTNEDVYSKDPKIYYGIQDDTEMDVIMMDHCYAKPWSAHPDVSHARPTRRLYIHLPPRGQDTSVTKDIDVIDVESLDIDKPSKVPVMYDHPKAKVLMDDCERLAGSLQTQNENIDDWEENVNKTGWTSSQQCLFFKIAKILRQDRLARLAYHENSREPILRRISVDKCTRRFRQAVASVNWELKLTQWLHNILMTNLTKSYMAGYLDILQTLRAKVPSLVDKMVGTQSKAAGSNPDDVFATALKKQFDPAMSYLSQNKPKKLRGNPVILIIPNGPVQTHSPQNKRQKFWTSQLSHMGKVVPISVSASTGGLTVSQCLENMVTAVRTKVVEMKTHFPNRPIVLVGWGVGSLIALNVSLVHPVTVNVCLGFPFSGLSGKRGDVEDPLLEVRTPTLFVIGQHSAQCNIDDLEDFREVYASKR